MNLARTKQDRTAYLFLAPFVIGFLAFSLYPLYNTFALSFTDTTLMTKTAHIIGIDNFKRLFADEVFLRAVGNTWLIWMANFIHNQNSKLQWAAAPFPHPADRPDLANATVVGLDVLSIPRGCKHVREAFEFVKFTQTQHGMELLCLGQRKHLPLVYASPGFLKTHPNPYIQLFIDLGHEPQPAKLDDIATTSLFPAFVISELRTAFTMGFVIYIPFLVIDLVVSSILLSMGMMMLPPSLVSLPFKLLLFVMVDGWYLIVRSLILSFTGS